jgi:hypothetical protein
MNSKSNISGVLSQTKIYETKQKDAVLLTEENVLKLRLNKIENYQNTNEMLVKDYFINSNVKCLMNYSLDGH